MQVTVRCYLECSFILHISHKLPAHRVFDVFDLRHSFRLQLRSIGHGDVRTADALDRRIEIVEGARLEDRGSNLGADARLRPAFLGSDQMVGLVHRFDDGLAIEWPDVLTQLLGYMSYLNIEINYDFMQVGAATTSYI